MRVTRPELIGNRIRRPGNPAHVASVRHDVVDPVMIRRPEERIGEHAPLLQGLLHDDQAVHPDRQVGAPVPDGRLIGQA